MSNVLTPETLDPANMPLTLLKLKGWYGTTDDELSAVTGIKRRSVANKLRGLTPCTAAEALAFARAFGIDLEVLYMTPIGAMRWVLDNQETIEARSQLRSRCLSDTCRSEYVEMTFDFEAYEEQTLGDYDMSSRLVSSSHAA
jgi:hypothetical protein